MARAEKSTKKPGKPAVPTMTPIAENRRAKHEYELLDQVECGMVLMGTEVKSLRDRKVILDGAFAREKDGELWLLQCEIPEYPPATVWNHEPKRQRKLLLHPRELRKLTGKTNEKGYTLVPVRMYFTARGIAKVVIALARGKQAHDKRETLKKSEARRDIDRAMKVRRQG